MSGSSNQNQLYFKQIANTTEPFVPQLLNQTFRLQAVPASTMADPFSNPPQRPTRPPTVGEFVRISKKTFLALLNELPFQELDLQSRFITDDEDTSATNSFIQELGRALSNVRITPSSADKPSSPKKLLSASLDRRNL